MTLRSEYEKKINHTSLTNALHKINLGQFRNLTTDYESLKKRISI